MKTPRDFIQEWMDTVCSNDSNGIARLYKEDAVLLGTLDKSVRKGIFFACTFSECLFSLL